jgi:hypothetical protein
LFWVIAIRRGTSFSNSTAVSWMNTIPPASIEITSGSSAWVMGWALVLGRSTSTPTVSSGAVTMKTTRSTSMTSTKGVTLISLMGW